MSFLLDKRSATLFILLSLVLFCSFTFFQGSSSSNPAEDESTYTVYRKQYDITLDADITDEEWWQADPIEFELDDGYGNTYQVILRLTVELGEQSPPQPVRLFGCMEISDETPDDENYFYFISWAPEQEGPGAPGNNIIIVPVTCGAVDSQVDNFYIDYWWFMYDDVQNAMGAMCHYPDLGKYYVEWMMELNNGDVEGCDPNVDICSYLMIAPGYGDYYPEIDEGYVFDWFYELDLHFVEESKPKIPTEVTCKVSKSEITVGDSVTISGRISPAPQPSPTLAQTVNTIHLEYSTDGITWNYLGTAIVDLQGKYSYEWTPPSTGTYQVTARFNEYYKQEADECTTSITVEEKPEEEVVAPPIPVEYYYIGGGIALGAGGYLGYRWYTKRKKRPPKPPKIPVKPISVPAVPYPKFLKQLENDLKVPSEKWKRFKEYKTAQHIDGRVVDKLRKDISNIKVDGKKLKKVTSIEEIEVKGKKQRRTKVDLKGWDGLTQEQKKDYLRKAADAVIKGLGLDKMDIQIKFVNKPDEYIWKDAAGKKHTSENKLDIPADAYARKEAWVREHHGSYSPEIKTKTKTKKPEVTINLLDFGRGGKGAECLDTIVHELRHAYQDLHKKDKNYYGMIMKANDHNYVRSAKDPKKYRNQPMEADAWKFAEKGDC